MLSQQDLSLIKTWADRALAAPPVAIPVLSPDDEADFLLVTDASAIASGAFLIDLRSGDLVMLVMEGGSDDSNISEPWAIYNLLTKALPDPELPTRIHILTDNAPFVFALRKGFAAAWHSNRVIELFAAHHPKLVLSASHIPGIENPLDPSSRGRETEYPIVQRFANKWLVCDNGIREVPTNPVNLPYRIGSTHYPSHFHFEAPPLIGKFPFVLPTLAAD